jgi:hypothetical protein
MTKTSAPSSNEFKCKYCNKGFRREKTLIVHVCEPKRRYQAKDDTGPRIGMQAFQRFYNATQSNTNKVKTHADFISSPYYLAFVKFGWFMHQVRAINPMEFVDFLLKNNVKLDWWTKDRYYEKFIVSFMQKEPAVDALTRTMGELIRWAKDNESSFERFFIEASPNKIVNLISNGRLSPWFLFNCDQGVEVLGSFNEEQLALAFKWIDPDAWHTKFEKYPEDVAWIREVLDEAGFND